MITKVFKQKGTFEAYWAAEQWCRENNISFGSMCNPDPTGLLYGKGKMIMKWRNLSRREIAQLDGKMTGNFREGPVKIEIKEYVPDFSV